MKFSWLKLCMVLLGILCFGSFLASVEYPAMLFLGYLFGMALVALVFELPAKDDR